MNRYHHALFALVVLAGLLWACDSRQKKPLALSGAAAVGWAALKKRIEHATGRAALTIAIKELPVDAVEKFVADIVAKLFKVTDPAKVQQIEAAAPKLVDAVVAVIDVVKVVRSK